jgi:hypothetical protein
MKLRTSHDKFGRQEVNAVEVAAVGGNAVDLSGEVLRALPAAGCDAVVAKAYNNDVALDTRPLALDPKEPAADLEDEVVAAVLGHGL